jgi:hypothetical protein
MAFVIMVGFPSVLACPVFVAATALVATDNAEAFVVAASIVDTSSTVVQGSLVALRLESSLVEIP